MQYIQQEYELVLVIMYVHAGHHVHVACMMQYLESFNQALPYHTTAPADASVSTECGLLVEMHV